MIARLFAAAHRLLSDSDVREGHVEMRIALAQAAMIGVPLILIALGFMAAMP